MIESAPHQTGPPMGVLADGIPAIRLRGIPVQPAIHVMKIVGCKPLQHLPLSSIPARSLATTNVLSYHSDALTVDSLPPGHDFAGRPLQLRRVETAAEEAWDGRRAGESGIEAIQHLDLDPAIGHAGRNVRRLHIQRATWRYNVDRENTLGPGDVETAQLPWPDGKAAGDQQPIATWSGENSGARRQFETVGLVYQPTVNAGKDSAEELTDVLHKGAAMSCRTSLVLAASGLHADTTCAH